MLSFSFENFASQSIDSEWPRRSVRLERINQSSMKITQLLHMLAVIASITSLEYVIRYEAKKKRCLNPPRTARRVESVIRDCQEEVKNKLVTGKACN